MLEHDDDLARPLDFGILKKPLTKVGGFFVEKMSAGGEAIS